VTLPAAHWAARCLSCRLMFHMSMTVGYVVVFTSAVTIMLMWNINRQLRQRAAQ